MRYPRLHTHTHAHTHTRTHTQTHKHPYTNQGLLPTRLAASMRSGPTPRFDGRAPVGKMAWNCRPDTRAVCPRRSGIPNVMMRGIRKTMITSFATRNVALVAPLKQAPHEFSEAVETRWVLWFRGWVGIIRGFKLCSHLAGGADRGGRVCLKEWTRDYGFQFSPHPPTSSSSLYPPTSSYRVRL